MCKKRLVILLRARMRPNASGKLPLVSQNEMRPGSDTESKRSDDDVAQNARELKPSSNIRWGFDYVRESMKSAITTSEAEDLDVSLDEFSEGYLGLPFDHRRTLLLTLAKEYDLNRKQVQELIKQYLSLPIPNDEAQEHGSEDDGSLSLFYRIEKNLRQALKPSYEVLFERLNTHPGGLKFLSILRADILSILVDENVPSLRALDSYLKENLSNWLSPATLELHQITWDDSASLLEKIVAYEAVHPISNLLDLKRRLGVGRRCFGYLHPAIPGEPLIFIEVALLKNVAETIQEVLLDNPPIPEAETTCALFYSISSTQPGLAGINLGKFLIKRVITLVKRDMQHISTFATLSPVPGFMQWLLSKLASQSRLSNAQDKSNLHADGSSSTFKENVLLPEEESALMNISDGTVVVGKNGMEVLLNLLNSEKNEWADSPAQLSLLKPILLRLCTRYLLREKKRGKALDSVANFHLQNGAMVKRLNWMADRSEKGLHQSGGIMVNYIYRMEHIEEYANSYISAGRIHASPEVCNCLESADGEEGCET